MQNKALKYFYQNRLWINGLWAMVMASVGRILVGNAENRVANFSLIAVLFVGAIMVVLSPFHSKSASSKAAAFLVSAITVAIMFHHFFS